MQKILYDIKRISAAILFLLLFVLPMSAQNYGFNLAESVGATPGRYYHRYEEVDLIRQQGVITLKAQYKDSLYYLSYGWSRYLGTLKDTTVACEFAVKDGFGIEREVVYDNVDGGSEKKSNTYQYYVGEWKNDKRHGNGYLMTIHKDVFSGKWKNGNFILGSKREVSEAEREFVEKCVDNINKVKVKRVRR